MLWSPDSPADQDASFMSVPSTAEAAAVGATVEGEQLEFDPPALAGNSLFSE